MNHDDTRNTSDEVDFGELLEDGILVSDPQQAYAHGVELAAVNNSAAAGLDDFYVAHVLAPDNPLYCADLVLALHESGREEEAREFALEMRIDPEQESGWDSDLTAVEIHRIALVYDIVLGDHFRALEYFAKAYAKDPEHLELQISYAINLEKTGYEDESYAMAEKIASDLEDRELSKDQAHGLARAANLLCACDPVRANMLVQKSLDAFPASPDVLREAGAVSWKSDDFVSALERFRRASELDPDSELAWGGMQESFLSLGMFEEAFELGQEIIKRWDSKEARFNMASAAMNMGWHDEAEQGLMDMLAMSPDDPHVHMGLGVCYALEGKEKEAREYQRRGLELGGDDPDVKRVSDDIDRILDSGTGSSKEELLSLFLLLVAAAMNKPKRWPGK